uniref:ADF-H domain-containing protein n=1 Tax=Ciona savignyi TaxID=51511 RepID=H2ZLE0_CIOSA
MAQSGINISANVISAYASIRVDKSKGCRFKLDLSQDLVFLEEGSEISKASPDPFKELIDGFPDDACRYALLKVRYSTEDMRECHKLCFLMWTPNAANITDKMLTTSTKDTLKAKFPSPVTIIRMQSREQKCINTVIQTLYNLDKMVITGFQGKPVVLDEDSNEYIYA